MTPLEQFLATRAATDRPDTQERYSLILSRFFNYQNERGHSWEKAKPDQLDLYTQHRAWERHSQGGLYSANTLDQERRVLRQFYRWAFCEGLVRNNPTQHWILPRPHQPERNQLTRLQVQQLLNLPDITTPQGQRDQLLMELLYGPDIALEQMHLFTTEWNPDWAPIRTSWERYLNDGRRRLMKRPSDRLLLGCRGEDLTTPHTLRSRIKEYGRKMGLVDLECRHVQQSFRDHTEQLAHRHTKVHRPGP